MNTQKEISLRNAISYCIENNDVNTATNRIMEFIRDEKEAITVAHSSLLLKEKEAMTFEEFIRKNVKGISFSGYLMMNHSGKFKELSSKYDEYKVNL